MRLRELDQLLTTVLQAARSVFLSRLGDRRLVRIRYQVGPDSVGDTSMYVWLIFGEETPHEALSEARGFQSVADEIRQAIRLAMRNHGVGLFQYVRFLLESEEVGMVPRDAADLP